MIVCRNKKEITNYVISLKGEDKKIGFVPTMGALHEGHLSLIEACKKETDITVVSIFVNPIQFNNKKDLEKYPRNEKADIEKLRKAGCDYLFIPAEKEMYPEKANERYNLGGLDEVMEGAFRPGHFQGVAVVVKRLFDIVPAHNAYFGKKDFQQLSIIKYLVKSLDLNINIVGCETVRDEDGLAKSSRNILLDENIRQNASIIPQTLFKIPDLKNKMSLHELKCYVKDTINATEGLKVEYFEIVEEQSLAPLISWKENIKMVACIAVYAKKIRLIDNISV